MEDTKESSAFYKEALVLLKEKNIPFLLAGGFAHFFYTGIYRDTKDMDIFCRPDHYLEILKLFSDHGFKVEHTDARWLAKVFKGDHFIDVIFDSVNTLWSIDESWFRKARHAEVFDVPVLIIPPEELIWCKLYVQNRERYDGADINHIILKSGNQLDWHFLLDKMSKNWQILLAQLLQFQFVYPADRDIVPRWLMEDLLQRALNIYNVPPPKEKVSRGPLIDQTQYKYDILEMGYKVLTITTI